MPTPSWLAATSGSNPLAGQVNQFLGTHTSTMVYNGTLQANQPNAGASGVASNGTWIAQSFTTAVGQTTIGRIVLGLEVAGSPAPMTVGLYANLGGAPSGSPLVSTVLPREFVTGSVTTISVPLPVTGLTASTTYWVVTQAAGTTGNVFTWWKSTQTSGASTSTNGTTWSAQSYGLLYFVYDQSVILPLTHTWEDSGARWTSLAYTDGFLTTISEYTLAQAGSYLASTRTLAYSGANLTGIT